MSKLCRWGILGAANIARKNWQSIHNSGNGTLFAVGSREKNRAQAYIDDLQRHVAYATKPVAMTYDELLASPEIDAVYIPLPTAIRKQWVEKAANAGKHVLCEKPCAPTAEELADMIDVCKKNNVQFMDGVMFMHSDRLGALRSAIDDGQSVGPLRRIASQFSFFGGEEFHANNIRVNAAMEPLGALGDLGWYNIRLTLWVMKYQMPSQVSGRILQATPEGVPLEFSGELFFDGGASASFYCSFETQNQQWANIAGVGGMIHLRDFVLPFYGCEATFETTHADFEVNGCQFNMKDYTQRTAVREYSNNEPNAQETKLFRNFAALVLSGKIDPRWPEIALKTQKVLNACLNSARQDAKLVTV